MGKNKFVTAAFIFMRYLRGIHNEGFACKLIAKRAGVTGINLPEVPHRNKSF